MDNVSLSKILRKLIGPFFGKVFSKNELIRFSNKKFYVYNTAQKPKPGHFVALYICHPNIFVFDSLGNEHFPSNIFGNSKNVIYVNKKQIQSNFSSICSIYVIYFIWSIYKKMNLKKIFSIFSDDRDQNDTYMFQWYMKNRLFRNYKQVSIIDSKLIHNMIKKLCSK